MKIARQRVSATKSGNGLQKTLQTISIWRWLLFILFFYFSVVLVVIGEKSPEIRDFPRQPARQRDSNRGCNGLSFSEWKLHLFCDLHKTVHRFFRRVAGVRCRVFTLPALLSAIFGKHSWVREVPPAGNALVHNLVDFPDFPLLRFVKGMVQGFLVVKSVSLKSPRFFFTMRTALATASMLSPTPEAYTFLITSADCSAACPVSPK